MTPRPVVPGFHPDPSVVRVGDAYWMVHSSFEYAPGVPLYRSADLVSWEQVGHVLARPSQLDVSAAPGSGGITAPTLRHHDGRFWLVTTNLADGGWQLLTSAEDPLGDWSDPVRMPDVRGIDPDLTWDDDGTLLVSYAGFGAGGPAGLVQQAVDPATGTPLTGRRRLWQGTGGRFPEGPHLYRVGGHWYLLIAEGGTERGHAVTMARGPSPAGPWEPCPHNPLLTHRGVESPVQNTGHADLVQRADGSWAVVFHGVRPRGTSPQFHVLGRETFAAEVEWADGWPRLGEWLTPPGGAVAVTEDLAGPAWAAPRRFPGDVLTRVEGGWRLTAADPDPASEDVAFVGRRQEHEHALFRAVVRASDGVGGLTLRIDARHSLDVEVEGTRVRAVAQVGPLRQVLGEAEVTGGDVTLEIRTLPGEGHFSSTALAPDVLVACLVGAGGSVELGRLDGRYVSTEVAGGMTGRLGGVWCARGSLVVRSFAYAGADDPQELP
ncbi:glycoside hydrolase family 43 protein [Geodermatophilus nigrescens]|uniref:Glycosyl hydrolases family 43 n=1 Tax=Geodermatophilus nigrescens TaxID=1070870 RepID=A0A1M5FU24_9ACTN|nr:glycoside hydrolase family 43 protein [Geodermatophilus nigrescens]SHF95045.1 Glycosyl hydrolases family 43 [Geodermatophilus nigrescens]